MDTDIDAEKIPVRVFPDEGNDMAIEIGQIIGKAIKVNNDQGKKTVLGLATGNTPLDVYRELIRLHKEENLSFRNVITFNLDEYYGLPESDPRSYHRFMRENLFDYIDIKKENIHIPDGSLTEAQTKASCAQYEEAIKVAGGIDIQILGIGRDGHIGFNEPGSPVDSRTRLVILDKITKKDALPDFSEERYLPERAITMGVAAILESRQIILIARGDHKAKIIKEAAEGELTEKVTASCLQKHPNAAIFADQAAASELTRCKTPWVIEPVNWSDVKIILQAVSALAQTLNKPFQEISEQDFRDNHLASLADKYNVGELKERISQGLRNKIKHKHDLPNQKKIVVFSPHPDDDIISAGGTMRKLLENQNELITVYMTPGYTAVFDYAVENFILQREKFAELFGAPDKSAKLYEKIREFYKLKTQSEFGLMDIPEVLKIKTAIRMVEAISACQFLGIKQYEFLEMPFYQTGVAQKMPVTEADVNLVENILAKHQPDIIFVAYDLNDPNGSHRLCLNAVQRALDRSQQPCLEMWLYRGAWQEFPIMEADAFIAMTYDESMLKKEGIFRHESQKDKAPQPGSSDLEFWQRAEKRNMATAQLLKQFGAGDYYAAEAFRIIKPEP